MRGKLEYGCCGDFDSGLIPAHAGKTIYSRVWVSHASAHPRACGENHGVMTAPSRAGGSSPRMRGKRDRLSEGRGLGRLIPAHAGKTIPSARIASTRAAHPRACGENAVNFPRRHSLQGSSPRMRGKPGHVQAGQVVPRLIPAHAGKTSTASSRASKTWAHPRACGENLLLPYATQFVQGSSPRMRGKPGLELVQLGHERLIPAHAGKTLLIAGRFRLRRAHPRACGENAPASLFEFSLTGSSPRMRGKHGCPL